MLALPLLLYALALSPPDTTEVEDRQSLLQSAIRAYVQPVDPRWDSTAVRVAWVDLNRDGREDALVYLTSRTWCGSGGCTVLVFEAMDAFDAQEFGPYRPAAEISLMHGPIHVVRRRNQIWSDLVVEDGRGALRTLRFNGETYPYSPAEGRRVRGQKPPGQTVFATNR
jgi:hypothetical protein